MTRQRKIASLIFASALSAMFALFFGLSGLWFSPARGSWSNAMTIQQLSIPYWKNVSGNETIIYNEIVTPIRYGNSANAIGFLTYSPSEIISVKNYSLTTEYDSSKYTISGNQISFPYGNGLPYMQESWLDNKDVPSQYQDGLIDTTYNDNGGTNNGKHVIAENALTRTNFLCITYKYNSAEQNLGFTPPTLQTQNFPNLLKKLNNAEPVKILVFGDSISFGASASELMGFEPKIPTYFDQIKNYLAMRYYNGDTSKITLVNPSVGGKSSPWGVQQATMGSFDKTNYDLVIIAFGMNDGSLGNDASLFKSNIVTILSQIRSQSPSADFIVVGTFTPNPYSTFNGVHSTYMLGLQEIANDFNDIDDIYANKSGCTFVNMYDISTGILAKKTANNTNDKRYQYMDISANYTNHPNDFMIRLYAGAILSTFIDF